MHSVWFGSKEQLSQVWKPIAVCPKFSVSTMWSRSVRITCRWMSTVWKVMTQLVPLFSWTPFSHSHWLGPSRTHAGMGDWQCSGPTAFPELHMEIL